MSVPKTAGHAGSGMFSMLDSVPGENGDTEITGRLSWALQAIQKPMLVPRGVFRNLMEDCPTDGRLLAIGGHRGMGENLANDHEPLMLPCLWRENTLKSFNKAEEMGATFVEFDVQVTRDGVPVVWHDDTIAFGSPFLPMTRSIRELSYQEFKCLGPRPTDSMGTLRELIPLQRHFRSKKTGQRSGDVNLWRCFDDDELPTLMDVFQGTSDCMGLNLEVKMTTPSHVAVTPPEEVDFTVNAILDSIDEYLAVCPSRAQSLVLSSFDPDVCIALRERQCALPVFFLTTGGSDPHADPRRTSVRAAIDLALENRLEGIVVETAVLKVQEHLLKVARAQGLKVMTYGLGNDDAEWVKRQSELGVHGAIVDDMARVVPQLLETQVDSF